MKPISEVTFCVVDSGLFLPMAYRLAQDAKRVLYWSPDMRAMPSIRQACVGDGFDNIERVDSFAPHFNEIDCFCFPDVNQGELQVDLEARGKAVWGCRQAEQLELDREFFMLKLGELGLDVPDYETVEGWSALCNLLEDSEDVYIKISKYRGDFETKHWRSWEMDAGWLYKLAVKFGPMKEQITFMVCPSIEADLEIGADTYNVDGQWPGLMLHGIEGKDKCYFSAVTARDEMPDSLLLIMDAFAPFMEERKYRNQWSMEVRINDDGEFFIDATTRGGMPSSGSQQLVWSNFPEIVYAGAHGELVEPEPAAQYTIECMVNAKGDSDLWHEVAIDPKLLPWLRFSSCCFVDGKFCFPPGDESEGASKDLGWLVALGDSPRETLDRVKELAELLPSGLSADIESLTVVIEQIEAEKKEGIEFSSKPVPDPAEVL